MRPSRTLIRFLWSAVIFLAFIGMAVATRRTIALWNPGAVTPRNNLPTAPATPSTMGRVKGPAAGLDAHFASQRTLTLAHVLPAMLFMVLGPLQFVRAL